MKQELQGKKEMMGIAIKPHRNAECQKAGKSEL